MIISEKILFSFPVTGISKKVTGKTMKIGRIAANQQVAFFSRVNNSLLGTTVSDENGNYEFQITTSAPIYIVALDSQKEFNAVVQDNVVPK